ncbi:unnamed protein product [Candidula unifasciata]|uniref:Major facilitator superfamily (MFS) profile domain-containing protein n=1 Tax=Candidula unifasciata TaxID=100452 RepID=A0A8S3YTH3_9EUPU|nr:unnamed protein product [Candidula unifasciata]
MIAWMNNWGPVCYVLTGFFFPWLLQVKGLKWATLTSMLCVAVGTACRVITSEPKMATILIHVGQFMNGVGGPISTGAIPAVSAAWFHPTERVTATALSNSINSFGTAVAFILGPALVPEIHQNKTTPPHKYLLFQNLYVESSTQELDNTTISTKLMEREKIMMYMYYVCGWSCFLFVVILCYFPSKPRLPPSLSATVERQHYWADIWSLRKKGHFIVITQMFGVSSGMFGGWISVLHINLSTVSVSEETAGLMGFYSTLAGCVGSLLIGRFAGPFVRSIKVFILITYALTTAALTVFTLMLMKIIPPSTVGLYVTVVAASTTLNIAVPLFFELGCELAYPTSEGSANGVLTLFSNFWALIFLVVFSLPNIDTMWLNWAVVGAMAVCLPLLLILKGRFSRLEVDEGMQSERYTENVIVVPDANTEHDPLLSHEKIPSDSPAQYGIYNSANGDQPRHAELHANSSEINGFTNPILSDDMNFHSTQDFNPQRCENNSRSNLVINTENGIQNPSGATSASPSLESQNFTNPQKYGIQNPIPTDISHGNLDTNTEYGNQNPIVTNSASPSNDNQDITNPQTYGIQDPVLQDAATLTDTEEKRPDEYQMEDSLLEI